MSMRKAALAGGTSNQTWSSFEKSGIVTDAIQVAVMQAFDWPANWATNLPPSPLTTRPEGDADMWVMVNEVADRLEERFRLLQDRVEREALSLHERIDRLEQRPNHTGRATS